ncbi:hypothetical protein GN958_ATG06159, partial [Phytophthora infestans]
KFNLRQNKFSQVSTGIHGMTGLHSRCDAVACSAYDDQLAYGVRWQQSTDRSLFVKPPRHAYRNAITDCSSRHFGWCFGQLKHLGLPRKTCRSTRQDLNTKTTRDTDTGLDAVEFGDSFG